MLQPQNKQTDAFISTGIAGLDSILAGGLTRDRLYLLEGEPGTGKTTMALQFLVEGARRGEPVLYVTLAENEVELRAVAHSHGFSLDGITVHEIIPAESGPLGLELAAKVRPDLILFDIQLPGMDGHAVARALKSNPFLKHIPLVAVTSYAMVGDREKCLAAGAEGYIEKPIDPESFVAEVERFLLAPGKGSAP